MNRGFFYRAISNPFVLNEATLSTVVETVRECPFFDAGWMIMLKNLKNTSNIKYDIELKKASVRVHNRGALYHLMNLCPIEETIAIDDNSISDVSVYTDVKQQIATADYFSNVPDTLPGLLSDDLGYEMTGSEGYELKDEPEPVSVGDECTFNEWLAHLDVIGNEKNENEVDSKRKKNLDLIDAFLNGQGENERIAQKEDVVIDKMPDLEEKSAKENKGIFTATLADLYIKQKQYQKAINIFRMLSLKNPEKSTYFANRIEEIEKLID